jgi:hypothetical protein
VRWKNLDLNLDSTHKHTHTRARGRDPKYRVAVPLVLLRTSGASTSTDTTWSLTSGVKVIIVGPALRLTYVCIYLAPRIVAQWLALPICM